ncbi:hypothetical protein NUU61_007595 [Penicillium alfredii]|uniref:Checkpoint protein RAD24-like helical bundle domain-containing protein n=1 Tax=Penicillium alfredii TaxID=1506179 RepID=A0A9W9EQS0_9EURO|nr:uncharacterized protein NUU61_007595 [Penicillium alfredii]KAJ5086288.1 hypothetical protein NUU61_007595 [Penicillium alfredii]
MDGRPSKRQRRSGCSESESQGASGNSRPANIKPFALSSRPKARSRPSASAPSTRVPSSSPSPTKKSGTSPKQTQSKSLHNFFQPATDGQRWSSQKFEAPALGSVTEAALEDDAIEDDYDSYDEIFTQHMVGRPAGVTDDANSTQERRIGSKQTANPRKKTHHSKRFVLPDSDRSTATQPSAARSRDLDQLPWSQRFAPSNLDELAVHKKKVSDVQNWLEDAFAGRRNERLLVLRGPAGSGKTTTITLLSESLGFDIVEWKNPPVSEFTARDYMPVSAQFEEFLGRGDQFGGLDLEYITSVDPNTGERDSHSRYRILLIEEFPAALNRASSSLTAFRASLQRYLAASPGPPVVIVVSETLLSSASSISDNLTVHRLLGPSLYNHPMTTMIDFNSIAPTFMLKALRLILEREARASRRVHIPGPGVLDRISEIGDIRSAVSSLEFLCLKGDTVGKWGGRFTKAKKSRDVALTPMEQESLKMITQREASLGMFHAVGKVVYNKRLDASLVPNEILPLSPPDHLHHHRRPKISQVAVNELVDETGTDIATFISALHENYPPSCDGASFTDYLNGCIEALSDSDILSADRRPTHAARDGIGIGVTSVNGGVDVLRQEETCFQVASRGLLFALPYPVKRRLSPEGGRSRAGDAYKMFYPSSLRLWRESEEIDGLIDSWSRLLLDPFSPPHDTISTTELAGVKSWKSHRFGSFGKPGVSDPHSTVVTMMSRHDLLLHQLPYMAQIQRHGPESWQLDKITNIRTSDNLRDEGIDELEDLPQPQMPHHRSNAFGPRMQEEEKLILSDDDIVD